MSSPSLDDFPADQADRAEVFIYYVRLSSIIGRLSHRLSLRNDASPPLMDIALELQNWVQSLPPSLILPFSFAKTPSQAYRRDVLLLHLPYLTALALLYMSPSSRALPKASVTALLAASCIARIFQEFLARGSLSFVSGIGGWYATIAVLALLHGSQAAQLRECSLDQIEILMIALQEVAKQWHSAGIFLNKLEEHVRQLSHDSQTCHDTELELVESETASSTWLELESEDGVHHQSFFPGVTSQTSKLFEALYTDDHQDTLMPMPLPWPNDNGVSLFDIFDQQHGDPSTFMGFGGDNL